jgi:hypothetical protein
MAFADPTQTHCMKCGAPAATWPIKLHQNIGLIAAHQRSIFEGQICKGCVHREYWKKFAILVTVGWTSYYSIVIGPVLLILNTVNYVKTVSSKPVGLPPRHDGPAPQLLPPS